MTEPHVEQLRRELGDRYRIEEELGSGGMAVVHLAEDLRHGREVALKVMKPELAAAVGADRFLSEIRTTATLQHPHILPLFDSGEVEGHLYYVMPYVDGESLRDRLDREKQLPVGEAVSIVTKVANALHAAHQAGVAHRDIKPANILVSRAGEPLVADFGIALAFEAGAGPRMTETGLSVGTPHYMAPEQATGDQPVGPASDIYALGCVLYELLVGEPPFQGTTAQAVLGKMLTTEPPRTSLERGAVPPNVDGAIRKALEKIPADRFKSAADFARALEDSHFRYERAGVASPTRVAAPPVVWAVVAAAVLGIGLVVGWGLLQPVDGRPHFQVPMRFPEDQALAGSGQFEISHDGSVIVYQGVGREGLTQLWARRSDEIEATPIQGTEGLNPGLVPDISISPDGDEVAFYRGGSQHVVPVTGGTPRAVVDSVWGTTRWSPDGDWIYLRRMGSPGISRVPADGGTPEIVTRPDTASGETGHVWPDPLPGGERVVFESRGAGGAWIKGAHVRTGETVDIVEGRFPRYVDGRLLFLSRDGTTILSAPFDEAGLRLEASPEPLVDGLLGGASVIAFGFAVSRNGLLAYMPHRRWQLTWVTRDGATRPVERDWSFDDGMLPSGPVISPGGDRIALRVGSRGTPDGDVWVKELDGGPMIRITDDEGEERPVGWLDQETLVVLGAGETGLDVWTVRSDGAGELSLVHDHPTDIGAASVSGNGQWLAFVTAVERYTADGPVGADLYGRPLDPGGEVREILRTEGYGAADPRLSPEGDLIAYVTGATGRAEVVVRPFPDVRAGRVQVSTGGGNGPVWSPDGSGLYFVNEARNVVFAEITGRDPLAVRRELLFPLGPYLSGPADIGEDGAFLSRRGEAEIVLVIDWPRLLE